MGIESEEFKDRADVAAEIKKCAKAANAVSYMAILLAVIGVVADIVDTVWNATLGLRATSWLLLAVFAAVLVVAPSLHLVMAKQLLGTEIIKKQG